MPRKKQVGLWVANLDLLAFLCSRHFLTRSVSTLRYLDADNELKFSVNEEGRYVAEEVPRQVGIRAGAIVEGVVRAGHVASDVEPLVSDDRNVRGKVTLGQLAKKHKINLEADTLVIEKKARYCTHLSKLDTKDYGLPQTRNRKVRLLLLFTGTINTVVCFNLLYLTRVLCYFAVPFHLALRRP